MKDKCVWCDVDNFTIIDKENVLIIFLINAKLHFRYEEDNLKIGRKKTNVMIMGDGKGKTVITGGKNVMQNLTTFHTASFGKFSYRFLFSMVFKS